MMLGLRDVVTIVALMLSANTLRAQEQKPFTKRVDPATIAAYEKLGAYYSEWEIQSGAIVRGVEGGLPTFIFSSNPKGRLPEIKIPFGLALPLNSTDEGLREVSHLKNLTLLSCRLSEVTDVGLGELAAFQDLTVLDLSHTRISDGGLKKLAGLKNLTTLDLRGTHVTDAGLRELAVLRKLSSLDLGYTKVTGSGFKELKGFQEVSILVLGTQTTDESLRAPNKTAVS